MLIFFCRLKLEKTNIEEELKHQKALFEQLEQQHNLVLTERKRGVSGNISASDPLEVFSLNRSHSETLFNSHSHSNQNGLYLNIRWKWQSSRQKDIPTKGGERKLAIWSDYVK